MESPTPCLSQVSNSRWNLHKFWGCYLCFFPVNKTNRLVRKFQKNTMMVVNTLESM